jgi:excisionase family DNA binding protein
VVVHLDPRQPDTARGERSDGLRFHEDGVVLAEELNLKQVARLLDVHYMTVYRYVRSGRLVARKVGTGWLVDPDALERFRTGGSAGANDLDRSEQPHGAPVDWIDRLRGRLVVGDEAGAWRVIEAAMVAGWEPEQVLVDLVSGAVRTTSHDDGPAAAHLAVTTATRMVALVAARFRRSGRSRGTVVLGAPLGEGHTLGLAVVADVLRLRNLNVLDLGTNVPPDAFAAAADMADRLVAVGLGISTVERLEDVEAVVHAVHEVRPNVPVLVGGRAVANPEVAALSGGADWAPDAVALADLVETLLPVPRARKQATASTGPNPQFVTS